MLKGPWSVPVLLFQPISASADKRYSLPCKIMVEAISQFFASLPETSQAAIIASVVTLTGALFSAMVTLLGVCIIHRGNEKRFRKQQDYDRKQKRIERRAEIVAELYSKLVELKNSASAFVRRYNSVDEKSKKQYLENLWRAVDALDAHFDPHRIYFERTICTSIDSFRESLSKASSVLAVFVHDAECLDVFDGQVFEEWEKANVILEREIPAIIDSLDASFRLLLDIED